ncbi:MAG: hypothetical protein HFJ34_08425 [Clostridia bacterium]|nr:hypothetical protein [Clostridia bacterium]
MCENEKVVLENLFESREENICALTEMDRQKIKRLTRNYSRNKKYYKFCINKNT